MNTYKLTPYEYRNLITDWVKVMADDEIELAIREELSREVENLLFLGRDEDVKKEGVTTY